MKLSDLTNRGMLKLIARIALRQENLMTQMTDALARLSTAVADQKQQMQSQIDAFASALEAERTESQRLAEAEAIEDVNQDQALSDARAQTDQALADLQSAVSQVDTLTQQVQGTGTPGDADDAATPGTDVESDGGVPSPDAGGTDPTTDTGAEPAPAPGEPIPSEPVADQPVTDTNGGDGTGELVTDQNEGPAQTQG